VKIIESKEINNSFGMNDLSIDEILNIDGGYFCIKFNDGSCGILLGCYPNYKVNK